jgi:heptosyltransferase-2
LARPIENLGIRVTDYAPKLFPSESDRAFAYEFLKELPNNVIALHPGSGSTRKNWRIERWIELGDRLLGDNRSLLIVSGEADQAQFDVLQKAWNRGDVRFATNLPLPNLAAVLADTVFIGHDSGISHLSAAAGAKCLLLFGPTDPEIWAPAGENVKLIRAPDGDLNRLSLEPVLRALNAMA